MQQEVDYLERRAREESERAKTAQCSSSARSHREMSKAYRVSADTLRCRDGRALDDARVTEHRDG